MSANCELANAVTKVMCFLGALIAGTATVYEALLKNYSSSLWALCSCALFVYAYQQAVKKDFYDQFDYPEADEE
jgi:hypothetical protein